ncbi:MULTISPECIES: TnsD family Tn7-like transposition protein [Pseudomonas]|uniref:Tn7-like transposition protein D n=2 Tax=Pseudomonas TaxID=286 RepID=A0ABY0U516_9PSED|nr:MULTISPECIES: TnsD family Tn7-like transposition protein [Pseudomonas]MEE4160265.1 TnsD family Tn7-like transposition protein [Pseudomonas viridiflava]MBP0945498.1 TniQ family protein [Pseudomonas alliivorans]MCF5746287.1 transposase [Pseudomonas tremae]MEE4326020.1 TnsD family Tn7-like transposition protein [Pseudomonas alliivorans]MEE4367550.1 TnsD family Tn7-like transposition protein [Pseudomonas alliivorans]
MSVTSGQEWVRGQFPRLDWLPDETLFSLCSRQHLVMGNLDPATTSTSVLGLSEKFIKHDIPCGIAALEQNGFHYWGNAESILLHHTIFSVFIPFQNKTKIEDAIITIKGDRIDSLKYRLGLVSSGFGAEHPLKACPYCMREDVYAHGIAYWHLTHQYPGVLICPRHQAWLMVSTKSRRWSGRFEWSLPTKDCLIQQASSQKLWLRPAFLNLANNVIDLAVIGRVMSLESCTVAATYRKAVLQGGRSASLLDRIEPLRRFHLFESLPEDEKSTESFMNQLIRTPRRSIHPLKHLLLIDWLFDDLRSFLKAYDAEVARLVQRVASTPSRKPDEQVSLSNAAAPTKNTPRPKRLKGQLKEVLLSKLGKGIPKQKLCKELDISVSTINRLLRANPVTNALAIEARNSRELAEHRAQWQYLHNLHPELGVQALRNTIPSIYAWLYRNDKAWLMAKEQTFVKPAKVEKHPIDWEARDSRLLSMIRTAYEAITGLQRGPVTTTELYARVPMLSSCLENRNRYPASRAFLSTVLHRSKSKVLHDHVQCGKASGFR